jgi:23S rRNA (cytidine2498-2'-O)-methyltransferase
MVRAMSEFAFACCGIGMERALKAEVARAAPSWRLAFSRPGLVTFKSEATIDERIDLVFARVWGRSRGRAAVPEEVAALIEGVDRVHVFARDPDEPIGAIAIAGATDEPARDGELVADVIVSAGDPIVVGAHRAASGRGAYPGGGFGVSVPADAPSRAYAKIEEAIAWRGLSVEAGQTALEIGAAPGGAALALARRGVHVIGVDTGAIDPAVLAYVHANGARVTHLPIKVGALRWEALPARVDWLLVDVNLAPQVAIHAIARLMPPLRVSLRGIVFTLKLNDLRFADELPALLGRIQQLGFRNVRARHLPSNRQEVCAVGVR